VRAFLRIFEEEEDAVELRDLWCRQTKCLLFFLMFKNETQSE
jgi:hypothetical protein